jgi:RHS repeat-associated protein
MGELCNVASASTSCGTQPSSGTSYQYSGNGLRITATTSTTTTDSAWDTLTGGSIPLNINDEATTSGATTNTSYLYGNLLFGGSAPLEQITTTSSGATPVFLIPNLTGVQEVVSTSGSDDELAIYSVYGKQTIPSGSKVTPFGFQGSYADPTGLIYLINRYYDPSTDQFLSIDPDVATTDQPYLFTNDDPLNAEDPLGLQGSAGVQAETEYDESVAKKCDGHPDANGCRGINVVSDVAKAVTTHIGDIVTGIAIGTCIAASAGICAGVTVAAFAARVTQRAEEGVPINSSSTYLDAGITLASFGLVQVPSAIGEGAVQDSQSFLIGLRIHSALPDILGWLTGVLTGKNVP